MAIVDITGLDKSKVLVALWQASRMQGMSFLGYTGDLDIQKAKKCIEEARHVGMSGKEEIYFDYLNGKVMKIDIAPDIIDTSLYDRDNGEGAGEKAIETLRMALEAADKHMTAQQIIDMCEKQEFWPRINAEEIYKMAGLDKKPFKEDLS